MDVNEGQSVKPYIYINPVGRLIVSSLVQLENAPLLIKYTVFGSETDVSSSHL